MKKGEIALSAFCIVFFSYLFFEAFQLHGVGRFGEMGSGFWPMLSLGASLLLSLAWLVSTLSARGKTAPPAATEANSDRQKRRKKVVLSVGCMLAYIVAMPWIGFIAATFLFVPAFALALDERRKLILLISPFLVTAITIAVFAKFITIPFPKGVGIFAEFSRLFY